MGTFPLGHGKCPKCFKYVYTDHVCDGDDGVALEGRTGMTDPKFIKFIANTEILAKAGVSLKSAAHPVDGKTIERLCRAVCKVYDIDPDKESEGLGVVMPRGMRYKLWEAQRQIVTAVLDELAVIDSEMQLSENNLETKVIQVKRGD